MISTLRPSLQRCVFLVKQKCPPVRKSLFSTKCSTVLAAQRSEDLVIRSPHQASIPSVDGVTLQEFLLSKVGPWGNQIAYECSMTGYKLTHNEVHQYGKNFGAALRQAGLKQGDVAIVLLPNCPQFTPIILGMLHAGVVASLINPGLTPEEIMQLVAQSGAKGLVTIPQLLPLVNVITKTEGGASIQVLISASTPQEGVHSFFDMIKTGGNDGSNTLSINPVSDPAMMLWSSGTTGLPKGVILTHQNLASNVSEMMQTHITAYNYGKDVFLGLVPTFHVGGLMMFGFVNLVVGGKVITMPKMDPELYVKLYKTQKFTISHVVPPLMSFMAAHPAFNKDVFDSIHCLCCGGSPTSPDIVNKVLEKAGKYFFYQEVYGMTETSGVMLLTTPESKNKRIGSVGRPVQRTECKIIDPDTGKALGPNQKGELCMRGPQVMRGYLNNEEATRDTVDQEGWIHTGDLAYYDDPEQYFYIVGRTKELIKVKGLQVAPSELEEILGRFPKISDVAVIGVPDERAGELPRAYVVKAKDMEVSKDEVYNFLKGKVSEYKQLRGGIEFVDSIPRAATGKILRKNLRALYDAKKKQPT